MATSSRFKTLLKKLLFRGGMVGVTYVAFSDAFYGVRTVDGISMQPTLNPGGNNTDFVLLDRSAASSMKFERGEVVSLVSPKDPSTWLIKRVVALEGDKVSFGYFNEAVDIPKGHCWVEGDNQECSLDSQIFGPVPTGLITAKATRVLWPPERWGKLGVKDMAEDRLTKAEDVERGRMFFGWDRAWEEYNES